MTDEKRVREIADAKRVRDVRESPDAGAARFASEAMRPRALLTRANG
jgi:hypothetical protein